MGNVMEPARPAKERNGAIHVHFPEYERPAETERTDDGRKTARFRALREKMRRLESLGSAHGRGKKSARLARRGIVGFLMDPPKSLARWPDDTDSDPRGFLHGQIWGAFDLTLVRLRKAAVRLLDDPYSEKARIRVRRKALDFWCAWAFKYVHSAMNDDGRSLMNARNHCDDYHEEHLFAASLSAYRDIADLRGLEGLESLRSRMPEGIADGLPGIPEDRVDALMEAAYAYARKKETRYMRRVRRIVNDSTRPWTKAHRV